MTDQAAVDVCEVFTSIQGESTWAGASCFFVRLAGCNLRCVYCDTPQAFAPGRPTPIDSLVARFRASGASIAEITGGEPLLQRGFPALAAGLRDAGLGRPVLVETNGSCDLALVPDRVVAVMDVKCPGSGQCGSLDDRNIVRLRPLDEVKFVLTDRADYEWARAFVARHELDGRCGAVLFSPAHDRQSPAELARWILDDRLPVRLQVPLHRLLGVK